MCQNNRNKGEPQRAHYSRAHWAMNSPQESRSHRGNTGISSDGERRTLCRAQRIRHTRVHLGQPSDSQAPPPSWVRKYTKDSLEGVGPAHADNILQQRIRDLGKHLLKSFALSGQSGPSASPALQRKSQPNPRRRRERGPATQKCPLLVSDVLLSHGLLRSTIGARGLNFRVRNGTGCASPAMVADQQGAFQGYGRAVPSGPHSVTSDGPRGPLGIA